MDRAVVKVVSQHMRPQDISWQSMITGDGFKPTITKIFCEWPCNHLFELYIYIQWIPMIISTWTNLLDDFCIDLWYFPSFMAINPVFVINIPSFPISQRSNNGGQDCGDKMPKLRQLGLRSIPFLNFPCGIPKKKSQILTESLTYESLF